MGSTKKKVSRPPKNTNNDSSSSTRVAVIIAIIGLVGTLGAAYISYLSTRSQVELPILATRTADALQASIAMTTQAYLPGLTATDPTLTTTPNTPTIPTTTPTFISTSTPSQIFTVEDQLVLLIDDYYTCINFANPGSDNDYEDCWNLLSDYPGEFQSNLNKNDFKSFWKKYKVIYALYYCSKNLQRYIDAKYYLYDRSDLSRPIGKGDALYLEYSFALDENGWRIKRADDSINNIGSYCESQPRIENMTLAP